MCLHVDYPCQLSVDSRAERPRGVLRPRRGSLTDTKRTEAFSDGVFAVTITLLALDLFRVHADPARGITLAQALGMSWSTLLAFGASFAFIGVAWTNHHALFTHIKLQSTALIWANLLLLAGTTMYPSATSILAQSLGDPLGDGGRQEILLYAALTVFVGLIWGLTYHVVGTNPKLLKEPEKTLLRNRSAVVISLFTAVVAAVIGYFWSPLVATGLFLALAVFYGIAPEGFEAKA
jgi:uncharacterized membrane protein